MGEGCGEMGGEGAGRVTLGRMRVTTWNVNGLRAALRKGFAAELAAIAPDVLLLQEVRAEPGQLPEPWAAPPGWHVTWHPAQKPGYSGTAVWSRRPHRVISRGLTRSARGADAEGRVLRVAVQGVQLASVYLPSGSSSPARQVVKDRWLTDFAEWSAAPCRSRTPVILAGDLNVAHTERDIFYARANQNQSGFLPHERQWFGRLLDSGWHDLVREAAGDVNGPYSWWSNRGRARDLDRGWRIDYLLANPPAARRMRGVTTHRAAGLRCSDHAPVSVDLDVLG